MNYLMVLPVPFYPLGQGRAAVESAFALHLQKLLQSLGSRVSRIEVLAPALSASAYEAAKGSMGVLDSGIDRVSFVEAFPAHQGRLAHLIGLPRLSLRLWRAVGRSQWVHASGSSLFTPFENIGLLFGCIRRRWTIYVIDIDYRKSARMNLKTGAWSRAVVWRREHIHDAWSAFQLRLARMFCSTLFLKGEALVRDFGRGQSHVHCILDAAHGHEMLLDEAGLQRRLQRLLASSELRVCYFGRLVAYKGIDDMLKAIHAVQRAGVPVRFDVYGDGDCARALKELAAKLGLDSVVRFQGAKPYGMELFQELDQVDVLLAAPLSEDTPRSALDAQARGISVLAFDTYYYVDLAAQGAGVEVVPWLDVGAMATELIALHADRERLAELARKAVAFASDNTQEIWLRRRANWTPGL